MSDVGIVLWLAAIATSIYAYGFATVFRVYLVPYIWYTSRLYHYLASDSSEHQG